MRKILFLVFIALGLMVVHASAQTVAGYHVFYGPWTNACFIDALGYQVCSFNVWVNVGNVLQTTITNTDGMAACDFAVTAYYPADVGGFYDSLKSNEVVASTCIAPGGTITLAWNPPGGQVGVGIPRNLRVTSP